MSKKEIENKMNENTVIKTAEQMQDVINAPVPTVSAEEIASMDKHVTKVNSEYRKAEKAFINVACEMRYLQDNDNFLIASSCPVGRPSFDEFAQEVFGFKKTQTYALTGIVNRFGIKNEDGTFSIVDKYKSYGQTQLVQIAKLTDEQISEYIKPSMTISDIKKIVKKLTKDDVLGIAENTDTTDTEQEAQEEQEEKSTIASNGADVVTSTGSNTQAIMSFDNYNDFVASLNEVQQNIARIFKANPKYKVTINYEW